MSDAETEAYKLLRIMEEKLEFHTFGDDTIEGCCICGEHPCKLEPRFGYSICKDHYHLPPSKVQEHLNKTL